MAQPYGYAFILGCLTALCLPPAGLVIAPLITIPIMLTLITKLPNARSTFCAGWLFGLGYFMVGLYWITATFISILHDIIWFLPLSVLGIPAALGLGWGLAAAGAYYCRAYPGLCALAFSLLIFWAEYFRGHFFMNFPWNLPGYGGYRILPVMQIASIAGIYGVTLFILLVSTIPFLALRSGTDRAAKYACGIMLSITAGLVLWGAVRLADNPTAMNKSLTIQILQPNIPQEQKDSPHSADIILQTHLDLMKTAKSYPALLSIWPETVFDLHRDEPRDYFKAIAEHLPQDGYAAIGVRRFTPTASQMQVNNSLIIINAISEEDARYDKSILSPWGEKIPYEETLRRTILANALMGKKSLSAGPGPQTVSIKGLPPFQPQICYEASFPGFSPPLRDRPDFILLASNDDWAMYTTQPYQSFVQSGIRAIEQGVPVIRSANSGISAIIDAHGRTLQHLGLGKRGVITSALPRPLPATFYARMGDAPLLIVTGLMTLIVLGAATWFNKKAPPFQTGL